MKIRNTDHEATKIEPQMAPMIDIVFQLLIFFMLTLKIIEPEGDFNINMPVIAPPESKDDIVLPDIKVRLVANQDGSLNHIELGSRNLGGDEQAFDRLNSEILRIIGRPGNPLTEDMEVEIDADYNLNYRYVISAISACTGRYDSRTQRIVRYVEKVKFAPPRSPE